jgi:hypothetical protein
MRKNGRATPAIGETLALKIQELHTDRRLRGDQPLLRIDHRAQAARAPYQFDSVRGRLHRRGCRWIPRSSRSALYALWRIGPEEEKLACPRCAPVPEKRKEVDDVFPSDLIFGFLSIVDQFAGVLRERGREYRASRRAQRLRESVDGLYAALGTQGKDVLDVITSALDGILKTMREFEHGLSDGNGHGHNGGSPRHNGGRPKP